MSAPTIVLNLVGIMTHELYRRRYLEVLVRLCVHLGTIVHHTTCTCMHYDSNLITKCIIACRSTSRYHARYSCIHTCKFSGTRVLSGWPIGNWRIAPARLWRAGFRNFSGENSCIARAARPPEFDSLPSLDPDRGHCQVYSQVNSDFVTQ